MQLTRKTRIGDLLTEFPDLEESLQLNDIDVEELRPDLSLLRAADALDIDVDDLIAVIRESLGGELDPEDDEDEDEDDDEDDGLDGLEVSEYDDGEEDVVVGDDDLGFEDDDDDDLEGGDEDDLLAFDDDYDDA